MTPDTQQLVDQLRPRWNDLWERLQRIGLHGGDRDAVFQQLVWLYTDPGRGYHTLAHIRHCLEELDGIRGPLDFAQRLLVEVAIWFHDAVYIPGHPFSEEYSAVFVERTFDAILGTGTVRAFGNMVRLSDHRTPASEISNEAMRVFLDIDLTILGRPEAEFDAYEGGIHHEYQRVPWEIIRVKRAEILRIFLARERIYATDYFHAKYETQARRNLERSIAKLEAS